MLPISRATHFVADFTGTLTDVAPISAARLERTSEAAQASLGATKVTGAFGADPVIHPSGLAELLEKRAAQISVADLHVKLGVPVPANLQ